MSAMSSHEALQLTASFAFTAERLRTSPDAQTRANIYERASRIAFLRAHVLSRHEEVSPIFGQTFRRALFAIA